MGTGWQHECTSQDEPAMVNIRHNKSGVLQLLQLKGARKRKMAGYK
jgi:hypothetical protein